MNAEIRPDIGRYAKLTDSDEYHAKSFTIISPDSRSHLRTVRICDKLSGQDFFF